MANKECDIKIKSEDDDGFIFSSYTDETRQWFTREGADHSLFIENVPEYGSRYFIVNRGHGQHTERFPPRLSGPFETLDAAKAAYKMTMAAL